MHKAHPKVIRLAARASCDQRTALKFLQGGYIRVHAVRERLEKAAVELGMRTPTVTVSTARLNAVLGAKTPGPTEEDIDTRLEKAEALARLHGDT